MGIRSLVAWTFVVALTVGFGTFSVLAQSEGPDTDQQLFTADGIDASIVAREAVTETETGSTLLFERIELPPMTEIPARTIVSPELYYVQAGSFSIQDEFGFGTAIPAGSGLTLKAGTTFTAGNEGSEPATVLRLRVAQADATPLDHANADATPTGQPGVASTVLIELPPYEESAGSSQLFLARAAFSPGADTGEQGHTGPVGVYVESGTLTIASPSGFQGTIDADQGVVLPADMPLQASTMDSEAVALLVGIGPTEGPFVEVAPDPGLSPPTAPQPPTATDGATPQASPVAGATPVGTPIVATDAGMLLQMGEIWQVEGGSLDVQVGEFSSRDGIRITFTYRNLSDARVDFTIPTGYVDVHDDLGATWTPVAGGAYTGVRVILEPDDSFEGGWWWKPERVDLDKYSANVFVTFRDFGDIPVARWGFTVASGRILTIPLDVVDPAAWRGGSSDVAGVSAEIGIGR